MKEKLILLHGALGSKFQLEELKLELDDQFEVYSLNFEGHGGRPSTNSFSIQLFSENLLVFMQEKSIDSASIFGYSMGGYVALHTALLFPDKIRKIYTLGTKFNWDLEVAQKEVKMMNPLLIEDKIPRYAEKLKKEHAPLDWKIVMYRTAEMMLNMAKGAKLVDEDFEQIQNEVIIGIGSLDAMVSYEESIHVSTLLPNSKLIKLEGAKHPIDTISIDDLIHHISSN